MNTELQSSFDRIDSALTTLVESITAYNPSPTAATTLVDADDKLSTCLDRREGPLARDGMKFS